jgi:hypothetical protein
VRAPSRSSLNEPVLYLLVRLEIAFAAQAICGGISRPCRELPSTLIHFTYQYMDHTDSPERLGLKI